STRRQAPEVSTTGTQVGPPSCRVGRGAMRRPSGRSSTGRAVDGLTTRPSVAPSRAGSVGAPRTVVYVVASGTLTDAALFSASVRVAGSPLSFPDAVPAGAPPHPPSSSTAAAAGTRPAVRAR